MSIRRIFSPEAVTVGVFVRACVLMTTRRAVVLAVWAGLACSRDAAPRADASETRMRSEPATALRDAGTAECNPFQAVKLMPSVVDAERPTVPGAVPPIATVAPTVVALYGEAEDGTRLLVTHAVGAQWMEQRRLFYGPPHAMLEYRIESYGTARDGGTTRVTFVVDGREAEAFFPVYCLADGGDCTTGSCAVRGEECSGRVTVDGRKSVARRPYLAGFLPPGLRLFCNG